MSDAYLDTTSSYTVIGFMLSFILLGCVIILHISFNLVSHLLKS